MDAPGHGGSAAVAADVATGAALIGEAGRARELSRVFDGWPAHAATGARSS